jgi:hypothetical protein
MSEIALRRVVPLLGSGKLSSYPDNPSIGVVAKPVISLSFYPKRIRIGDFPIDIYSGGRISQLGDLFFREY